MSALNGDLTWGDIARWESDAYWGIENYECECGGIFNDSICDPETGEEIGRVCENCDTEMFFDDDKVHWTQDELTERN